MTFLEAAFAPGTAVVRSIPNTPAAIGRGITVAVPNGAVTADQMSIADALLKATGGVEWVEDEALIDVATAVSGSGPAYVFLLAEALAHAGVAAGMAPDMADRLARATVAGAGELIARTGIDPATLRKNVTSPNGTTAAALAILMDEKTGFTPLLTEAVAAAARRSRELAELKCSRLRHACRDGLAPSPEAVAGLTSGEATQKRGGSHGTFSRRFQRRGGGTRRPRCNPRSLPRLARREILRFHQPARGRQQGGGEPRRSAGLVRLDLRHGLRLHPRHRPQGAGEPGRRHGRPVAPRPAVRRADAPARCAGAAQGRGALARA